ncbi:hypothetical protein [Pseudobacteriovorax antillogorgiicola]|uniref:Uncharacterized protein n=1 Tax=Pseudobacteriovorax antillogorgiicola TaxID=1513793 RepID=A0A1Y6BBX4_9BACT|nr:hypothetical protein [Pseudobacteriovorax antillogorgiicola]TCS57273.1 hypothetical protein EDD56_10313 [Pseudobacteriovorax antillogorgiicola]SMF03206.1 hypothetical protein SAMN06296036_103320 [Pseudobacteriovorax antillogorgiicola]
MDIVSALSSGLLGAAAMFLFMELVTLSKLANADMVRAVGSLFTRRYENSLKVGLTLHLIAGLGFGLAYCGMLNLIGSNEIAVNVGIGVFSGFVHGFLVSYVILIEGQNRHPLTEFRSAGFEVAVAHVVGHVFYGAIVAYSYATQVLPASTTEVTFTGWDIYQTYMAVLGTLTVLGLVALSIKNSLDNLQK